MNDLNTVSKLVKSILEQDEQARNSDSFLYLKVLQYIADKEKIFLAAMPVPYFLENMKDFGFPPFESVRRTRQKIQADHPELSACRKVSDMRMENEKEYRSFAKGGSGNG